MSNSVEMIVLQRWIQIPCSGPRSRTGPTRSSCFPKRSRHTWCVTKRPWTIQKGHPDFPQNNAPWHSAKVFCPGSKSKPQNVYASLPAHELFSFDKWIKTNAINLTMKSASSSSKNRLRLTVSFQSIHTQTTTQTPNVWRIGPTLDICWAFLKMRPWLIGLSHSVTRSSMDKKSFTDLCILRNTYSNPHQTFCISVMYCESSCLILC